MEKSPTLDIIISTTIFATRQIKVNDMRYVYVETASKNVGDDKDIGIGSPKYASIRD